MLLIEGEIGGKKYREPFSKGILSKSLVRCEIKADRAYELASEIEKSFEKDKITIVPSEELIKRVKATLEKEDPLLAKKYSAWKNIKIL